MEDFKIGVQDMSMIYMSPDPYHEAFEQTVDLWKFDLLKHKTAGLSLYKRNGCVHLASIFQVHLPCAFATGALAYVVHG